MTEDSNSYPFSAGSGSVVTEGDWSDMAQDWGHHSGVRVPGPYSDPNPLRVSQESTSTVSVNPGRAKIAGYHYRLNSPASVGIPIFTSANRERIDYVGPTVDATSPVDPGSFIELRVRTGQAASPGNAMPPSDWQLWGAYTATPGLWDLPLAVVRSRAGDPVEGGYAPQIVSVEDARRYLGAEVLYAPNSTARPINPNDGQLMYEKSTKQISVYTQDQNLWNPFTQLGVSSYRPQVSGLTAGYTATGRYAKIANKLVWVSIHITVSRNVVPTATDTVRLYLPIRPLGGHRMPITFYQYSGSANEPNMTMGHALVNAGGYLNLYAPDPADNHSTNWELDAMNKDSPGTCLLDRSGAYLSLAGVYEIS